MQEEWFLKIRQQGDAEVPITPEEGKPRFKSEKQYLEDIQKRHDSKIEYEQLRNSEEYKEGLYERVLEQNYQNREAGSDGVVAENVVPSVGSSDEEQ